MSPPGPNCFSLSFPLDDAGALVAAVGHHHVLDQLRLGIVLVQVILPRFRVLQKKREKNFNGGKIVL
jgi:hypothetical protein